MENHDCDRCDVWLHILDNRRNDNKLAPRRQSLSQSPGDFGDKSVRHQLSDPHHQCQQTQPPDRLTSGNVAHATFVADARELMVAPARHHSLTTGLRESPTTTTDNNCRESVGGALDSGVSGMDVSISAIQEIAETGVLDSSLLPVIVTAITGGGLSTDESAVSSMSILSALSNENEDSDLPPTPVRSPSIATINHKSFRADHDKTTGVPSWQQSRHRRHTIDDDDELSDVKRAKTAAAADRRSVAFAGRNSPHPRRVAMSLRLTPRRSAVGRRQQNFGNDDSGIRLPWQQRQKHKHSLQKRRCKTYTTERASGASTSKSDRFQVSARPVPDQSLSTPVPGKEDRLKFLRTSNADGNGLRSQISQSTSRAVPVACDVDSSFTEISDNEPCTSTARSAHVPPAFPSANSRASTEQFRQQRQPVLFESSPVRNRSPVADTVRQSVNGSRCDRDRCISPHHNAVTETGYPKQSAEYSGSGTVNLIMPQMTSGQRSTQLRPRAESTDLERRRQLARLLRRNSFNFADAEIVEHVYDDYGRNDVQKTGVQSTDGQQMRTKETKEETKVWEMKTVF